MTEQEYLEKICEERNNFQKREIELLQRLEKILFVAIAQSADEGIFFNPQYVTEEYLQNKLRFLHEVIEQDVSWDRIKDQLM